MIRPATFADAEAIARIHVRAWRAAYRDYVSAKFLDNLSVTEHTVRWIETLSTNESQTHVCETNGVLSGWVCFGLGRDAAHSQQGEIYALYIDPAHWRSGIGGLLLAHAHTALQNHRETYLWVLTANTPARRFYEAMGYTASAEIKSLSWAGATLEETRYSRLIP